MRKRRFTPDPKAERQQLLILGIGFVIIGGAFWALTGTNVLSLFAFSVTILALVGATWNFTLGRPIYLLFALIGLFVGSIVSWLAVGLMYLLAIMLFGLLLRLIGMNRLNRDYNACKAKPTMFTDAPLTTQETFRRQS